MPAGPGDRVNVGSWFFSVVGNVRSRGASVVTTLPDPHFMQFFQEFSIIPMVGGFQSGAIWALYEHFPETKADEEPDLKIGKCGQVGFRQVWVAGRRHVFIQGLCEILLSCSLEIFQNKSSSNFFKKKRVFFRVGLSRDAPIPAEAKGLHQYHPLTSAAAYSQPRSRVFLLAWLLLQ
jgi:hypothetical protein